ncbi:MAG: hypothetical protein V4732_04425 [Pseudomonadota bacterium]
MATKSSFRSLISEMLEDERIIGALKSSVCFGDAKLLELKRDLEL